MSHPKPLGQRKAGLLAEERARLRALRAEHGPNHIGAYLRTSRVTIETLISGGGVTLGALERLRAELRRAS